MSEQLRHRHEVPGQRIGASPANRYAGDVGRTASGLLASFDGVRLYPDRIEVSASSRRTDRGRAGDVRPLPGVRAHVREELGREPAGRDRNQVNLTISGPRFEWVIRTDTGSSSLQARVFAARVNGEARIAAEGDGTPPGPATGEPVAPGPAPEDVAGQLERLAGMHRDGALTDTEFTAAKARILGS
ncbi:MAG TPA: SHOCT domain-containing protein [Pseudonocardia sp.]|jgi:hypothetical protein